jgi:hypothetical protein
MRKQIYAHLAAGGADLDPLTKEALETLQRQDTAAMAAAK